jgi:hypothetical protein
VFIGNIIEVVQTNSEVHAVNIRNKHDLHRPVAKLAAYQNGVYSAGGGDIYVYITPSPSELNVNSLALNGLK